MGSTCNGQDKDSADLVLGMQAYNSTSEEQQNLKVIYVIIKKLGIAPSATYATLVAQRPVLLPAVTETK
jgi:hypothetical protein